MPFLSRFASALLLPLALVSLSAAAPAQAQSPSQPYRILVGFPAGGTIDVVARLLADEMKEDLGAPVVIDSRPGAGGQIAAQQLLQAPPDGRTLLLSPDHTMVMLPLTVKAPGFKPQTDFAPVGQVARYPGGLAVSTRVEARSMDEFFAWARNNPDRANVGIPAPGSIPQFMVHLLGQQTRAPLVAVPYRGSAPLVQDLMAGQITAGTTALGDFLEPQAAGKLRVIGVLGERRSPALPQVPTFAEQGYKIDWEYWLGMFAPAGTPAAEVARINAALAKALAKPQVRQRMQAIEFHPAHGSPEALGRLVRAGTEFWTPVVRSSGFVPQ
ncbi:Bug family tripartite tricarboxylate transporter substrate binding protein [Ramlibacter sp. AN1015]|uniref:Bug family tripartite tricarboxylate transporter substrate binding protein n=1 Tax=Ramlibacter sp. AN1015 TaxID=3133428 RepID=UPI0030C47527